MSADRSFERETLHLELVLLEAEAQQVVDRYIPVDEQETMTYAHLDALLRILDPELNKAINDLVGRSVDAESIF